MNEEYITALNTAKEVLKVMIEDKALVELQAKLVMSYYNAYIAEGFSKEDAIKLVAALTGKNA